MSGTLFALMRLVGVPRWRLALTATLGALTVLFGVGLMADLRLSDLPRG